MKWTNVEERRAYYRRYHSATVDRECEACNGRDKRVRIDLGLELLALAREPGQAFTQQEVAAWAGCSRGMIYLIERTALKKLANKLRFGAARALRGELA